MYQRSNIKTNLFLNSLYYIFYRSPYINFLSLGDTPLCAGASAGQKTSCDILLRRGADTGSRNLRETPPLHLATR